jgi:nucleolar protein 9
LLWIVPGFLGCAPPEGAKEGELLADAKESDVRALMESRSGSHLFEAIARSAPRGLLNEMHRRFFRGKLRSLASHPVANFSLQAFLGATQNPEHVEAALVELGQDFGSLLRERRAGVVASLLAACARLRVGEKDAAKNLARGLTSKMKNGASRVDGRSQLAPALLWMDQHGGPGGARTSVLGAAMLQTIVKFPPDATPQFAESVASLAPREAVAAACDAAGSRALEAFLAAAEHKPKLKRELCDALRPESVRLALSACGSHVLQQCYRCGDQRSRENIIAALARDEAKIAATRHGPFLLKRLGVSQFKEDKEAWTKQAKNAEDVRADFAKTFGGAEEEEGKEEGGEEEEGKGGTGGKRKEKPAARDADENPPAEKKAKKEKKEKKEKEKKEKKEKKKSG